MVTRHGFKGMKSKLSNNRVNDASKMSHNRKNQKLLKALKPIPAEAQPLACLYCTKIRENVVFFLTVRVKFTQMVCNSNEHNFQLSHLWSSDVEIKVILVILVILIFHGDSHSVISLFSRGWILIKSGISLDMNW